MNKIIGGYHHYLHTYPLTTKIITSGCVGASGDILCQYILNSKIFTLTNVGHRDSKHYAIKRLRNMTLMSALFMAPVLHFQYSKFLPYIFPGEGFKVVLKKLAFH